MNQPVTSCRSNRLVWRFETPHTMVSSAPVGGGLGLRSWVLNIQVPAGFAETDLDRLVHEVAEQEDLHGPGVGLLTAADVHDATEAADDGVLVSATVGLRLPTWAAAPDVPAGTTGPVWRPGTINLVVRLPVACSDAALVNAVATATEAKTQALFDAGVPGTGTATDAVCITASPPTTAGLDAVAHFAGPRSLWGARLARAVHVAVTEGIAHSASRLRAEQTDDAGSAPVRSSPTRSDTGTVAP